MMLAPGYFPHGLLVLRATGEEALSNLGTRETKRPGTPRTDTFDLFVRLIKVV